MMEIDYNLLTLSVGYSKACSNFMHKATQLSSTIKEIKTTAIVVAV